MADSKTAIGNRDDLNLDASRCLRMRFSESSCQHCVDICPHGAVILDGGLSINAAQCHGCLLCTAVCPVGALEQKNDFSRCLARLSRVPEPVLGCVRTQEHSHATLACLGGLSAEHLLVLCHTLSGSLTLNLSLCSDCPNSTMIAELNKRLGALSEAGLSCNNCRIVIADSAEDIHCRAESVDRRSFFKSIRTSLFTSAAGMLSGRDEPAELRTDYSRKRLPIRRALLNSARDRLSKEMQSHLQKYFDSSVSFNENCTKCHGCVAICPTGALQTEKLEELPKFDQLLCSGCGLCGEFCMDEAVSITRQVNA